MTALDPTELEFAPQLRLVLRLGGGRRPSSTNNDATTGRPGSFTAFCARRLSSLAPAPMEIQSKNRPIVGDVVLLQVLIVGIASEIDALTFITEGETGPGFKPELEAKKCRPRQAASATKVRLAEEGPFLR